MRRALRDYQYTESGLDNIVLTNAPVYLCPTHGVQAVALQNIQGLHAAIANRLLKLQRPLRGVETRFLRKHHGWSQVELGHRLGVTEVTVSRWETQAAAMGLANEHRLRLLFTDPEAFAALQLMKTQRPKSVSPLRIPVPQLSGSVPSLLSR